MWKEGEIVTVGDKRYQIVKRETKIGSICEECRQANRNAQLLLTWCEQSECIMGGTMCHCNMNYNCYPKLLD